jgi:hypothetical protein
MTFLAEGHEDRVLWLRSWLSLLIRGIVDIQVVLMMVGPGGTGKSTFALLATALVGKEFTVTTSLRSLNSDPFEVANLDGKRLILVSDSERYKGDLSVLKQLSGGDALKGRIKFVQGSFEVMTEGLMLITANQPLDSEDTSDAIRRRLRFFPCTNRVASSGRLPLLSYGRDGFVGPISSELAGVINWVLLIGVEEARLLLGDPLAVVSLREVTQEVEETLNPLARWVRDEVLEDPDGGAYIGYKLMEGFKARHELSQRRPLYPNYELWSKNHGLRPITHRTFSTELIEILKKEGIKAERQRRAQGFYIKGIIVNPRVYDRDYCFGAPLAGKAEGFEPETLAMTSETTLYREGPHVAESPVANGPSDTPSANKPTTLLIPDFLNGTPLLLSGPHSQTGTPERKKDPERISISHKETNVVTHEVSYWLAPDNEMDGLPETGAGPQGPERPGPSKPGLQSLATVYPELIHPSIPHDLYSLYTRALGHSPLKTQANRFARRIKLDVRSLAKQLTKECLMSSLDYQLSVLKVLERGATNIAKFGIIPLSYKQMGLSPRLLPITYGNTLNNCKLALRLEAYQQLGSFLHDKGFVILDLDLTSCYTSILLGLYPQELEGLQRAIEGPGLWKFIQSEFIRNGKAHAFDKPAVKVCVYSSFFLGGNHAMMSGILEARRKDLGLTEKQFKAASFYEECYAKAQHVATEMMNSAVIADFRAVSKIIHDTYDKDYLIGPTGHKYWVDDVNFRSSYSSYLQSYEFALLAQATLQTLAEFPTAELIGHYHDGNVLAVKVQEEEALLSCLAKHLETLRLKLGLRYHQRIEVKSRYPK